MSVRGVSLINNGALNNQGSNPVGFSGGRVCFITNATSYGTNVQLQVMGPSGTWVNLGAPATADQVQSLDMPAGQFRVLATGSVTGLYAILASVAYL